MSSQIEAVLIDLSGTIHIEDTEIDGSINALEKLKSSGIKIKFLTNTTKESRRILHEKLVNIGFKINQNEIITSLTTASDFVRHRGLKPYLMIEDEAKEDFAGLCDFPESEINAVVIGLAPTMFDYQHLNVAFRLLQRGAELIAIHKGRYFKKKDGLYLGPGPFVAGLEQATDKIATILGKPEKEFFHNALKSINVTPAKSIMIGDDYNDDINGALNAGLKAILVKTGKYILGDEEKLINQPTNVCSNFSQAVNYILDINKQII